MKLELPALYHVKVNHEPNTLKTRMPMFRKHDGKGYTSPITGIEQKTLVYGNKTLMVEFRLKKGSQLPPHSHPHEQTGYLVKGQIRLSIGSEQKDVTKGDSWCIPGGVEHGAQVIEDAVAIEVFSPVREDYLPGEKTTK